MSNVNGILDHVGYSLIIWPYAANLKKFRVQTVVKGQTVSENHFTGPETYNDLYTANNRHKVFPLAIWAAAKQQLYRVCPVAQSHLAML